MLYQNSGYSEGVKLVMDKSPELYEAAVIVLHELASDSLILTERSQMLRDHPGEICFPGGRWEQGDATLFNTALRELNEELGVSPDRVSFKNNMKVEKTMTGFRIHPFLATIETLSPYQLNNSEVVSVLRLPMNNVRNRSNYKEISISRSGQEILTYQFLTDEKFVWGATARIMMQLC